MKIIVDTKDYNLQEDKRAYIPFIHDNTGLIGFETYLSLRSLCPCVPSDGMGGEIHSQESAENYFILMLEFFNNIRETERDKRSDEFNKAMEKS